MSRKTQRFLVTIWAEERTPADIALRLSEGEGAVIDPEVETISVVEYKEGDIAIEPGTSRMAPVPNIGAAQALPPPGTYQRLHCTACGEVLIDVLANAAPTACPACGGRSWRVGGALSPMARISDPFSVTQPVAPFEVHRFTVVSGPESTVSPAPGPAGP